VEPLVIDGSHGEGGGQILRTALALSAVLQRPVVVKNIRAKRPKPGLRSQHLASVQLLAEMTDAEVRGASLGSSELYFSPGLIRGGRYSVDVGTAGAVTLVLQTIILPALFADGPVEIVIRGGTEVPHAPTVDYAENVFLRFLRDLGADVHLDVVRRGYYPRGGGKVVLRASPFRDLPSVRMLDMDDEPVDGVSISAGLDPGIAERQRAGAEQILRSAGVSVGKIGLQRIPRSEVLSPGTSITLWSRRGYVGASSLGERGILAEVVGKRAARWYLRQIAPMAPFDANMGDQIVPFLFLARGDSSVRIAEPTEHLVTNLWVCSQFFGESFEVVKEEAGSVRLDVHGSSSGE